MRYVMKQKMFSWGGEFYIKNDQGANVYFVDGKAFNFDKKLSFQDMNCNELAVISQKYLSSGPTYEINRGLELVAVVKKSLLTSFLSKFTVDLPGLDNQVEAEGDVLYHEYAFTRKSRTVAVVSKQWLAWTDTYGVDVSPGEDDVLILSITVVIDMVCHSLQTSR